MAFLENLDNLHESQRLEFKEATFELPKDVWESYSAFANTEGGEIVLGVKQVGNSKEFVLSGVQDADKLISQFWTTLRDAHYINRDIMLLDGVKSTVIQGMAFVIINAPRASRSSKPISVYDRKKKQFVSYVRRGEGDFPATEDDLRLMSYDNVPHADRMPLENFGLDSLDAKTLVRYRTAFAASKPQSPWIADPDEDFLYHIGAIAKGYDGSLHPTQAGLLAFGHEYEITNYSPHYLLDYREETSGTLRWDDRIVSQSGDWSGNVIDFYFDVAERIKRHFKMPFATDASGMIHGSRNEITESVNEAIVNALVHAWYGASATVRVIVKPDEILVTNPGSMLVDHDVAIAGGESEPRNPTLLKIFTFIGAGDRAGSGLCKIWSVWSKLSPHTPRLVEKHNPATVSLTLPLSELKLNAASKPKGDSIARNEPIDNTAIMSLLASANNGLTPLELSERSSLSARRAQERLRSLYISGLISREKEGRSYRYRIRAQ